MLIEREIRLRLDLRLEKEPVPDTAGIGASVVVDEVAVVEAAGAVDEA